MTTLGIRHEDWELAPHGTLAAARRHYRRGTPVCEACKQAAQRNWAGRSAVYSAIRSARYHAAKAAGQTYREAKRGIRLCGPCLRDMCELHKDGGWCRCACQDREAS